MKSIKTKILLPLICSGLIIGVAGGYFLYSSFVHDLKNALLEKERFLTNAIHSSVEHASSASHLQRTIMALTGERDIDLILVVLKHSGEIIASSKNEWFGRSLEAIQDHSIQRPIHSLFSSKSTNQSLNLGSTSIDRTKLVYIRNHLILDSNLDQAALFVRLDVSELKYVMQKRRLEYLFWISTILISLILAAYFVLEKNIVLPTKLIQEVLRKRAKGDHQAFARLSTGDEIQTLADSLDNLLRLNQDALDQSKTFANALRSSEERYASIVSSAMDAIIIVDQDENIILFNNAAEVIFQYAAEQVLGAPLSLLIPRSYRSAHTEHVRKFVEDGKSGRKVSMGSEIYGMRSNSEEFPIEVSISKTEVNGKLYLTAILRDVTERKQTEEQLRQVQSSLEQRVKTRTQELNRANTELREEITERNRIEMALRASENRLREAQRMAQIGNWELDLVDNSLYWSEEIFRIFEIDSKKFGASYDAFLEAIHPEDRDIVNTTYLNSVKNKTSYSIKHRLLMPDGRVKYVHESGQNFYNAVGDPIRSVGTVQDITDSMLSMVALERSQKQLQMLNETLEERVSQRTQDLETAMNKAEQANIAKSEFLSRMSHELRTPLNAILGFTQLLQRRSPTEQQQGYIDEIQDASHHLLHLISDLLDLSRIETGNISVSIEAVDLFEIISECLRLLHAQIEELNIVVDNQLIPDCDYLGFADRTRVRQILTNLISNAIKYNKPNGTIEISQEVLEPNLIRVSIKDSGVGISEDYAENIFTPFERGSNGLTDVEGTGIGLALSKQLAELMGINLGYRSQENVGSEFWLDIPMAEKTVVELVQSLEKHGVDAAQINPISILYIEDNQANIRLVESSLCDSGKFTLQVANTGAEGYECAVSAKPDVILLDINLPDISGYEVLSKLKMNGDTKDIPIIALTADATIHDIDRGLSAGFDDYLTKPIDLYELEYSIYNLKRPIVVNS